MNDENSSEHDLLGPHGFYPFPCGDVEAMGLGENENWFRRFAGKSPREVAEILAADWNMLTPESLRAFAQQLATWRPIGLLHAPAGLNKAATWLVLAHSSHRDDVAPLIAEGIDVPGVFYLPAPQFVGPVPSGVAADNLVLRFFLSFGGLRLSYPFRAGFFNNFPEQPMELFPGEWDKFANTPWQNANALFTSSTGDELLATPGGELGWLMHDDRSVQSCAANFGEVLKTLIQTQTLEANL